MINDPMTDLYRCLKHLWIEVKGLFHKAPSSNHQCQTRCHRIRSALGNNLMLSVFRLKLTYRVRLERAFKAPLERRQLARKKHDPSLIQFY